MSAVHSNRIKPTIRQILRPFERRVPDTVPVVVPDTVPVVVPRKRERDGSVLEPRRKTIRMPWPDENAMRQLVAAGKRECAQAKQRERNRYSQSLYTPNVLERNAFLNHFIQHESHHGSFHGS